MKQCKSLLTKCVKNGMLDFDEWTRGLLSIRNTRSTGLSPPVLLYGHKLKEVLPAHESAFAKDWHQQLADFDRCIATERQKADPNRRGRHLTPLHVGDPVLLQDTVSKQWSNYGIVQERNLQVSKYLVRLPSGLLTVRNRHIRLRPDVPAAGTRHWAPLHPDVTYGEGDEPASRPGRPAGTLNI